MAKRAPERLVAGRNARVQSRAAFAAEIARRAEDQSRDGNTLLSPDEIAGDYVLERGLYTTLGGVARKLTIDDLRTFSANVAHLKREAKKKGMLGGIKAKQVINKSWTDDLKRAHSQIRYANPTHYNAITEGGGQGTALLVHFRTNASDESEFTHHDVNVQFLDFGAAVASPIKAKEAAKFLANGRLKFECNCGRFKYYFRYVCTQAEIVSGRAENSFPKIRNPDLSGISCKHGLRVMQTIVSSPTLKDFLAKAIQRFRDDIGHTGDVLRIADQRAFEEARKKESWRQRAVRTTDQKRPKATTKAGKTYESSKEAKKAAADAARAARVAKLGASKEYQAAQANLAQSVQLGIITDKQAAAQLAKYAKKLGL